MKSSYPQFNHRVLKNGNLVFTGELLVAPQLPIYTISIEYRKSLKPLVKVIDPLLVESPPHFYKQDGALCLYHPQLLNWNKNLLISKYIVSWSAAWIYFYEVWLQEGKWYGPEAPHNIDKI